MPETREIAVFLSYSTENKEAAGYLYEVLYSFGLTPFLAHEDIGPSEEWERRIFDELENCNVFVPLLTAEFRTSRWTDQESGIAYLRHQQGECLIVPVALDGTVLPYGFLNKFQAITATAGGLFEVGAQIWESIDREFDSEITNQQVAVERLSDSSSYWESEMRMRALNELGPLDDRRLVSSVVDAIMENEQIHDADGATPYIEQFVDEHEDMLSPAQAREFNDFYYDEE